MKKYPFTQKKDFLKLNMQHFAQTAKRSGDDEIMFGLADILIGEGDDLIKFDGKNGDTRSYLQVEGVQYRLNLTSKISHFKTMAMARMINA